MAPLKPHWEQPSHPAIQKVLVSNDAEYTTKSVSEVALAPFGLFARMTIPPCNITPVATYATVQIARDRHIELNSDLLYINHSCEPSLIFDTANLLILAGPRGLQPGDELTFFYPSTEWDMAQPFDCTCGTAACRGLISGARDMSATQLRGNWLNGHIRAMLEQHEAGVATPDATGLGAEVVGQQGLETLRIGVLQLQQLVDRMGKMLLKDLEDAGRLAEAKQARHAIDDALQDILVALPDGARAGAAASHTAATPVTSTRHGGASSRELGGEMDGDTLASIAGAGAQMEGVKHAGKIDRLQEQ